MDPARLHALLDAATQDALMPAPLALLAADSAPATAEEIAQVQALLQQVGVPVPSEDRLRQALRPAAHRSEIETSGGSVSPAGPSRWARWKARWTPDLLTPDPVLASRAHWLRQRTRANRIGNGLMFSGAALLLAAIGGVVFWLAPQSAPHMQQAAEAIRAAGSAAVWVGDPQHPSASYQAWKAVDAQMVRSGEHLMRLFALGLGVFLLGMPWSSRAGRLRPVPVRPADQLLWEAWGPTRAYLAQRPRDIPFLYLERDRLNRAISRSPLGTSTEQIGPAG